MFYSSTSRTGLLFVRVDLRTACGTFSARFRVPFKLSGALSGPMSGSIDGIAVGCWIGSGIVSGRWAASGGASISWGGNLKLGASALGVLAIGMVCPPSLPMGVDGRPVWSILLAGVLTLGGLHTSSTCPFLNVGVDCFISTCAWGVLRGAAGLGICGNVLASGGSSPSLAIVIVIIVANKIKISTIHVN